MKPVILHFLFILGLFSGTAGRAVAQQQQDADTQMWSETRLVYKLTDKFDVFTAGSWKLVDNLTDFIRVSARVGGTWAATKAFSISPSYFYTVRNPWTTDPTPENRVCLLTTYRFPMDAGYFSVANTLEYRMPEGGTPGFWLRPRIRTQYPVGPQKWGLDAFVSDELFYNNIRGVFTQDKAFAGFEEKFNDSFTVDLYYCRRTAMNASYGNANAICIDFKITFGRNTSKTPYEPQFR